MFAPLNAVSVNLLRLKTVLDSPAARLEEVTAFPLTANSPVIPILKRESGLRKEAAILRGINTTALSHDVESPLHGRDCLLFKSLPIKPRARDICSHIRV